MSKSKLTPSEARELIIAKLSHNFGVTPAAATDEHYYKAVALVLRDIMRMEHKRFFLPLRKSRTAKQYIIFVWNSLWVVHSRTIFITSVLRKQ